MRTTELSRRLGITDATIRQWTRGEFKNYMSDSAQGGDGKRRFFTDTDTRILAYIASLTNNATSRDEIHATLKNMQSNEWRDLPPMPEAPAGQEPIRLVPESTAQTAIYEQRAAMMREITILEEQIEKLETNLKSESDGKAALQSELTVAREQIGELRGKLAERPSSDYWLRLMAVAVLVAVVLTAALAVLLLLAGRGG